MSKKHRHAQPPTLAQSQYSHIGDGDDHEVITVYYEKVLFTLKEQDHLAALIVALDNPNLSEGQRENIRLHAEKLALEADMKECPINRRLANRKKRQMRKRLIVKCLEVSFSRNPSTLKGMPLKALEGLLQNLTKQIKL